MSAVSGLSLYTEGTERLGGATTASGSSRQASTVGGRKPQKQRAPRGPHKPGRIRQGSPHEERSLVEHILVRAWRTDAWLVGGLAGWLVGLLGVEDELIA